MVGDLGVRKVAVDALVIHGAGSLRDAKGIGRGREAAVDIERANVGAGEAHAGEHALDGTLDSGLVGGERADLHVGVHGRRGRGGHLVDHRQDRVRKDRALRILLEEGVRAGSVGVAAARAVGRHLVGVAEGALEERHRYLLDDRRGHRPNERASAAEQVVRGSAESRKNSTLTLAVPVVAVPAAPQVP